MSVLPKRRETKPVEPPAEKLTNEELVGFIRETRQLLAAGQMKIDESDDGSVS